MVETKKERLSKPLNIAAERVKLLALREGLKDTNDIEQAEKIDIQIKELEQMFREGKTTIDKAALINMRNLQSNRNRTDVNEVRDAHLSANPELDPFSRRQTKPTNVISWLIKGNDGEVTDEHNNGENKETNSFEIKIPLSDNNNYKEEEKEDISIDPETSLKRAHDFDLSLDAPIEDLKKTHIENHKQKEHLKMDELKSDKPKQKKPTLSVADYKRRMGLV